MMIQAFILSLVASKSIFYCKDFQINRNTCVITINDEFLVSDLCG